MVTWGSNQSEREKDNRGIVFEGHVTHLHTIRHHFVHVTSWGIEHTDTRFDPDKFNEKNRVEPGYKRDVCEVRMTSRPFYKSNTRSQCKVFASWQKRS